MNLKHREFLLLRAQLKPYERGHEAGQLLDRMINHAHGRIGYESRLRGWLRDGSSIELRELCLPFGRYHDDLAFANLVDTLDAAWLHQRAPVPTE